METRHGSNRPWSGLAWNQRYVRADGPKFDPFRRQIVMPLKTKSPDPFDLIEVELDLKFRDDRIAVPAIVRRRQQSRRALQFVMLHTSDARPRMATLQRIVRSMEQVWLKSRRG